MKRFPGNIPGLVAWHEADWGITTSGADITAWLDRSSSGFNLTVDIDNPTLVTDGGLPAADFALASLQSMSRAATNPLGNGAYSMYVVCKPAVGSNNAGIYGLWTTTGGAGCYMNGVNRTVLHPGVAAHDDSGVANAWELWNIIRPAGAKPLYYLNGALTAISSASTGMTDAGASCKLCMGTGNGNGTTFNGRIRAALTWKTDHNALEQLAVQTYLNNKYAIF